MLLLALGCCTAFTTIKPPLFGPGCTHVYAYREPGPAAVSCGDVFWGGFGDEINCWDNSSSVELRANCALACCTMFWRHSSPGDAVIPWEAGLEPDEIASIRALPDFGDLKPGECPIAACRPPAPRLAPQ